jgi:hypothetical protein
LLGADLQDANLQDANLRGADLRGANLLGANWDFSSGLPLWCGGAGFTTSLKFIHLIFAHLCTLGVDESEQEEFTEILDKFRPYALKSHRAGDLGLLGSDWKAKEEEE